MNEQEDAIGKQIAKLSEWWNTGSEVGNVTGLPAGVVPIEELVPLEPCDESKPTIK
ncbi:hypothetical protein M1555_02870 [Patescibacteria group bacterium]|nr:hypothetical protein [Patescibacteria group bacterium]